MSDLDSEPSDQLLYASQVSPGCNRLSGVFVALVSTLFVSAGIVVVWLCLEERWHTGVFILGILCTFLGGVGYLIAFQEIRYAADIKIRVYQHQAIFNLGWGPICVPAEEIVGAELIYEAVRVRLKSGKSIDIPDTFLGSTANMNEFIQVIRTITGST